MIGARSIESKLPVEGNRDAPMLPPSNWVRIEAAAAWLDCKVCFLRRLVAERRVPYSKVGKYLYFDLRELDEWLRSQRVAPIN